MARKRYNPDRRFTWTWIRRNGMPRQHSNVEFLNKLKNILGIEQNNRFAEVCGQQPPNMNNYLRGIRTPGDRVLRNCVMSSARSVFGWDVIPEWEILKIPKRARDFPKSSGVYVLYDSAGNVLYIGQATSFRIEVWAALGRKIPVGMRTGPDMRKSKPTIRDLAGYVSLYNISDARLRHNIEALLIRVFINQTHNRNIGNFRP